MNASHNVNHADDVLNSWKEIAVYLNRGVRTVQRWEAELGLPVRRPRGKSRSAVLAMRSELDAWTKACPMIYGDVHQRMIREKEVRPVSTLILRSRELQETTLRLQEDLITAMSVTVEQIRRMVTLTLPPPVAQSFSQPPSKAPESAAL
jgi:hypothetical protein